MSAETTPLHERVEGLIAELDSDLDGETITAVEYDAEDEQVSVTTEDTEPRIAERVAENIRAALPDERLGKDGMYVVDAAYEDELHIRCLEDGPNVKLYGSDLKKIVEAVDVPMSLRCIASSSKRGEFDSTGPRLRLCVGEGAVGRGARFEEWE